MWQYLSRDLMSLTSQKEDLLFPQCPSAVLSTLDHQICKHLNAGQHAQHQPRHVCLHLSASGKWRVAVQL